MDDLRFLDLLFGLGPVSRICKKEGILLGNGESSVTTGKTTKIANIFKTAEENSI
jgi:hypothetical protein